MFICKYEVQRCNNDLLQLERIRNATLECEHGECVHFTWFSGVSRLSRLLSSLLRLDVGVQTGRVKLIQDSLPRTWLRFRLSVLPRFARDF